MAPATLRWVLLRHECPPGYRGGSHWDLMLERAAVADERRLATWSLSELPAGWPGAADGASPEVVASALDDHRAAYLEYEGPLSGARGSVTRVTGGVVVWREATRRRVAVELRGGLCGAILLEGDQVVGWRLMWLPIGS